MKVSDLRFEFPENLVAAFPQRPSRVLSALERQDIEITQQELLEKISRGDVLVINDTRVEPRRVFARSESGKAIEILFIEAVEPLVWSALHPLRMLGKNEQMLLPGGVTARVLEGGLPQTIKVDTPLEATYFETFGKVPLPPYIQKLRSSREGEPGDRMWYQTAWADKGHPLASSAAPTASLHFEMRDLEELTERGVEVERLSLHVGLGTYLPVSVENLEDHRMHSEHCSVPRTTWERIQKARNQGNHVWAMGTTVARALESVPKGLLAETSAGFGGQTNLLIQEGFKFSVVDRLLTNFHQPESTLLALVMAFAGRKRVLEGYSFAISRGFRLFSYGDLSVWQRS